MSIESIYQEINNTTFFHEWSRNKKFLGNIFIDFKNKSVKSIFDPNRAKCKGVYLLSDQVWTCCENLYTGVSSGKSSEIIGRVKSHIRSIKIAIGSKRGSSNERSGEKIVNHFKDKDYAVLTVEYIDLEQYKLKGLPNLLEQNLIPVLQGVLNQENQNKTNNVVKISEAA